MAIEYKNRQPDGTLGEPVKVGSDATLKEQVASLGMQLAQEKISGMQKDAVINGLGSQVAFMKLELMQLKGGGA